MQVDHGPRLTVYSACAVLRDACTKHDRNQCLSDSFCTWEAPVCVAFSARTHRAARGAAPCARGMTPRVLAWDSSRPANSSTCASVLQHAPENRRSVIGKMRLPGSSPKGYITQPTHLLPADQQPDTTKFLADSEIKQRPVRPNWAVPSVEHAVTR